MKSLKNILASVILGAASLLPLTTRAADLPKPYVQTTLASALVPPSGAAIEEKCRQDYASIDMKGFNFGLWQNQFLGEHGISERDYCLSYTTPLASNLTANVGYQRWDYPNERFGQFDSVETAGLNYSGNVDASLAYTHLNKNSATKNGDRLYLRVSKPIPLVEGKTKISLSPTLSTAWVNNYYGVSGLAHISTGLGLDVTHGKWGLNISGIVQTSLNSDIKNLNWGTAGISYQF